MRITATITKKGQVTIPRAIRKHLKGRIVEFILDEERIEIRAVPSAAGALSEYAELYVPLEEVRERVWGKDEES